MGENTTVNTAIISVHNKLPVLSEQRENKPGEMFRERGQTPTNESVTSLTTLLPRSFLSIRTMNISRDPTKQTFSKETFKKEKLSFSQLIFF